MNELLILAAIATPLLSMPLVFFAGRRWLPAIATVPALLAGLLVPEGVVVSLPWLLLGAYLQLDGIAVLLLPATAFVWLFVAAWAATREADRLDDPAFRLFFLAAMSGNFLVILAADMVSFYIGFAMMGLAAYPLLLRPGQQARFSARIYLAFTLVGELALFAGMVGLYAASGSLLFSDLGATPVPGITLALLLIGFGIKVALPGLHFWLPLAYGTAPIITVAVLSGPMMKAGLLGWLRFLPAEADGLMEWGPVLMLLGAAGLVLGVWLGLVQREPRAVLAYSSIAKMGLITALFGGALKSPAEAAPVAAALVLFAMHHLLVKSALFLGVGEWEKRGRARWVMAGLGLLALTMIGAPLTGGALVKQGLGTAIAGDFGVLSALLTLSAIGTALLMARFMWLLTRKVVRPTLTDSIPAAAWLVLLPVAFLGPFTPFVITLEVAGMLPLGVFLLGLAGMSWLNARWPGLWARGRSGDALTALNRVLQHARRRLPTPQIQYGRLQVALIRPETLPAPQGTLAGPGLLWLALFLGLLAATLLPH
ncbi:MAG: NADH/ubiquinone/plastoquinone (complex I) [Gammaproteobacteria bacterium]|nr:NADH/ubiquinone/plastoquinone (complex I) [Gammaproteobacteria bacterium]